MLWRLPPPSRSFSICAASLAQAGKSCRDEFSFSNWRRHSGSCCLDRWIVPEQRHSALARPEAECYCSADSTYTFTDDTAVLRRAIERDEPQGENGPVYPALLRDWRELPSEVVEREQISRLLRRAIEMLPNTYRQVFLLRDVEESTINDTAKILDISTSLVKVKLHRARRMLRRLLEPRLKAISTVSRKMQFQ